MGKDNKKRWYAGYGIPSIGEICSRRSILALTESVAPTGENL